MRFLKLSVVVAALAFLLASGKLNFTALTLVPGAGSYLLAVALILILAQALSCIRWYWLIRGAGAGLNFYQVVRLSLIGNFFNTFLLGGMGGDVVKVAYVMKETQQGTLAAASILVDRIAGMFGLVLCGGLAMLIFGNEIGQSPPLRLLALATFLSIAAIALITGFAVFALRAGRRGVHAAGAASLIFLALGISVIPRSALLSSAALMGLAIASGYLTLGLKPDGPIAGWARERLPGGRLLILLVETLLVYVERPGVLLVATAISVLSQGITLYALYLTGHAIGLAFPLPHVLFAATGAGIANCLPVPLGGLGVGEASFDSLLRLCHGHTGTAAGGGAMLFLGWRILTNTFWVLTGLPFYIFDRDTRTALAPTVAV